MENAQQGNSSNINQLIPYNSALGCLNGNYDVRCFRNMNFTILFSAIEMRGFRT